jgi:hypothetical protein
LRQKNFSNFSQGQLLYFSMIFYSSSDAVLSSTCSFPYEISLWRLPCHKKVQLSKCVRFSLLNLSFVTGAMVMNLTRVENNRFFLPWVSESHLICAASVTCRTEAGWLRKGDREIRKYIKK